MQRQIFAIQNLFTAIDLLMKDYAGKAFLSSNKPPCADFLFRQFSSAWLNDFSLFQPEIIAIKHFILKQLAVQNSLTDKDRVFQ